MAFALDGTKVTKTYVYPSDLGSDYLIDMNEKYATVSGLTEAASGASTPRYPFSHKHLRHMYWHATDNNRSHSRRVPCKKYTPQDAPPTDGSWDGLTTWKHGSLIGERIKL